MTALETMREFVASYDAHDVLSELRIDYADAVPVSAGLFPEGRSELSRRTDLLGNVTVENQANFALYAVLEKAPDEDEGATVNAEWVEAFQDWVQARSATHQAPAFGDEPITERITAQNGAIYSADAEGVAVYAIQLAVRYTKRYPRE